MIECFVNTLTYIPLIFGVKTLAATKKLIH